MTKGKNKITPVQSINLNKLQHRICDLFCEQIWLLRVHRKSNKLQQVDVPTLNIFTWISLIKIFAVGFIKQICQFRVLHVQNVSRSYAFYFWISVHLTNWNIIIFCNPVPTGIWTLTRWELHCMDYKILNHP